MSSDGLIADVAGRLEFNAPIFRQIEFFGNWRESLKDGALDVDVRGNVAQFFELLDGFLFLAAAPEDIDVVGQGLHLTLGAGGLAGKFFGLLFVADLQVELRLALARHLAGFGDLFFELVSVFVRCSLVGEQLSLVLANSFNTAVERFHRASAMAFVGVVVVFIYRSEAVLFGLGPGLEFHFLRGAP